MQQAKTVKLDPDKWLEEVRDILTIAKDPNRADEFAALKQRMAGLRGKSVSLDEAVVNMDKFRLPLDGSSKEEVLEEMRQKRKKTPDGLRNIIKASSKGKNFGSLS